MSGTRDAVIIGGGIAGVSIGYELAARGLSVTLLEAEETLAHHSTGRSAAHYLETYGNECVRRLTIAGRSFFESPPPQLVDGPLWRPRPMMHACSPDSAPRMRARSRELREMVPTATFIEPAEALALMPVLRPDSLGGAMLEPDAMELDVAAIHRAFVRGMRLDGASVNTGEAARQLLPTRTGWTVSTQSSTITTPLVVNTAGAWCDRVAERAGVEPLGLHPLRRTAALVSLPDDVTGAAAWPLVAVEAEHDMAAYCKPEPGGLLISPADETPSPPCDARPEEVDVARAIDTLGQWTTLDLRHIRTSWAGLRTFAADRAPVAGFAPDAPGFFWLAGQGGFGIQTAPGLAKTAAGIMIDGDVPEEVASHGVSRDALAADRPGLRGRLAAP